MTTVNAVIVQSVQGSQQQQPDWKLINPVYISQEIRQIATFQLYLDI